MDIQKSVSTNSNREKDGQTDNGQDGQKQIDALPSQLVTILTTEHYNLQTGRSMTISEATGRASLFLSTVSSTLVALAFVGQIAKFGTAFFVFSLVLFPSLIFLGLVTFERVLQSSIEDTIYARGINRLRHLYLEYAPQMEPYFILSRYDDNVGMMTNMGVRSGWWQTFLSMPGMIQVINSILSGAFVGLLLYAILLGTSGGFGQTDYAILICAIGGIISFLISVALHQRYQLMQWQRADQRIAVRFPTPPEELSRDR